MAFGFFMNMEKLSLLIIENQITNMTNDNYEDDIFLNSEKLINNIKNGFVIITQLSCFIESFLNTIITGCMNYKGEALLKCSIDEKIELIFMHYQKDWAVVKERNPWAIHRRVTKVRNEMIHFKKTYIGDGGGIPNFKLGGQEVAEFFTKKNMEVMKTGYEDLAELIASALELTLFKKIGIFECDGRDGLVNYVYDENEIEIDESRFE